MKELNIPKNIKQILEEEGIWENNAFDPILITIMESDYKGKDVISFQMEFPASAQLGKINDLLKTKDINLDGDKWQNLIREYLKLKNPDLEQNVHDDSEGETCVLWTETKENFEEMMKLIFEFIEAPNELQKML